MIALIPLLRRAVPYLWVGVAVAVLHLGWVGFVRYDGNARAERAARVRRGVLAPPVEDENGFGLRITQFYASAGEIIRGDRVIVCYGVREARSVRLDPPVEALTPASNRCFWVRPGRTTTYRLVAEGEDGTAVTASFTVKVSPPPPRILFVSLSESEVRRGRAITICYGVENAVSARLEPVFPALIVSPRFCLRTVAARTTKYTLIAEGADGRTDREPFTIRVLE
jgi:hypothetical protein